MPLQAVGLAGVFRSPTLTAQDVLGISDRFKVVWVDTVPRAAQVVEGEAFRNGAVAVHIGNAMHVTTAPLYAELSVAVLCLIGGPQPATRGVYLDLPGKPK